MIAVMPDFARIDRELAAIGTVPEAVQPLLDQYGQRDRSLENVDVVLEALREGREPTSSPPDTIERPSFLPLGWDADRKSEPGVEPAPAAIERDEITANTGLPQALIDETPVAEANAPAAEPAEAPASTAPGDDDGSVEGHIDTQLSSPPPPAEAEPSVQTAAPVVAPPVAPPVAKELEDPDPEVFEQRVSRSSRPPRPELQALLDAELDPREFPSTPPRPSRSSPPAAITSPLPPQPSAPSDPDGDELELLVDDDDILEIEEDE